MSNIEKREQAAQLEDIERAAWFARLALGAANPEPLPQPVAEKSALEYQVLA